MANKKLRGIVWPNLPNDTYLLDSGEVDYSADASYREGTVGKALQSKANIDGSYSDLTAGNAEQIVSSIRANDKTPYLFRTSGGSVDIGDREYINGIVGVSLPWNQLINITGGTKTDRGITATMDANGVITLSGTATATYATIFDNFNAIATHKYMRIVMVLANPNNISFEARAFNIGWGSGNNMCNADETRSTSVGVSGFASDANLTGIKLYVNIFDITQLFGSTIADYIYSLEQSTTGAGVAWFKKLFPKPYYPYDSGSLKSVEGLVSHDTTGFNQWDEEWTLGYWNYQNNGAFVANSNFFACKNKIPVLPNTAYFWQTPSVVREILFYDSSENYISRQSYGAIAPTTFTTPTNAHYMTFYCASAYGTTYNNDICINFHWDGSRDGEYEPYVKHSYPLDSDLTLRGIPKLDANNNLYYDGDTYESDGTVTRKYGIVDMGTLDWRYSSNWGGGGAFYTYGLASVYKGASHDVIPSLACTKYIPVSKDTLYASPTAIAISGSDTNNRAVTIRNSAYTDAASFTASVRGVMLVYELETPTTETADPYTTPQIVDDFGTEQYALDDSAFPVPVGHDTDYPVNLVAKLEMSPNSPSGDGDYIVRQTNGENTYVPLVIEDALPTIPSATGSYKLTVTVAEGSDPVLSWEAE